MKYLARLYSFSIILCLVSCSLGSPVSSKEISLNEDKKNNGVLTVNELLIKVGRYHPEILSADLQRRIAGANLLEKQGAFDAGITLDSDYLRYNSFKKRGDLSQAFDNSISLNWLSRSGLKFSTGARYNTGDISPPLYPTGDFGEYFMGVKMPLLRGFRLNKEVISEMQAELGIPKTDAEFNKTRLNVMLKAASSYWDWVIAHKKMEVSQKVLELSKFRLESIEERVKQGDLPRIDAVEAKQEVFRREGSLINSRREFEKQTLILSRYLWEDHGKPSTPPEVSMIPAEISEPEPIAQDRVLKGRIYAIENRPEVKSLNLEKKIVELDLKYAKNQLLPAADLFATPGYDTGHNSVGFTVKTGFSIVIPLRQRTATGLVKAAEYEIHKLDMNERLLLQDILLQVDDSVSAINAAYEQFIAARQEYELARVMEQGEKERYNLGDSNLFLINQRERATAEAAVKMLDIKAGYYKAVEYFRATSAELLVSE